MQQAMHPFPRGPWETCPGNGVTYEVTYQPVRPPVVEIDTSLYVPHGLYGITASIKETPPTSEEEEEDGPRSLDEMREDLRRMPSSTAQEGGRESMNEWMTSIP